MMAGDIYNVDVSIEPRYLEKEVHSKPQEMHYKVSMQQRVSYVKKLPHETRTVLGGELLKTFYAESKSPTDYFMVDSVVVFTKGAPDSFTPRQSGAVHQVKTKEPHLENIKKTMYASSKNKMIKLSVFLGIALAGRILTGALSFEDKLLQKVQTIVQMAFTATVFLAGWRTLQWNLFMNKLFSIQNLGGWAAQMRAYAYKYPALISQHGTFKKYLLPYEATYLSKGSPFPILTALKNNLSL